MKRGYGKKKEIKKVTDGLKKILKSIQNAEEVGATKVTIVNEMEKDPPTFGIDELGEDILCAPLTGWVQVQFAVRYKRREE